MEINMTHIIDTYNLAKAMGMTTEEMQAKMDAYYKLRHLNDRVMTPEELAHTHHQLVQEVCKLVADKHSRLRSIRQVANRNGSTDITIRIILARA